MAKPLKTKAYKVKGLGFVIDRPNCETSEKTVICNIDAWSVNPNHQISEYSKISQA